MILILESVTNRDDLGASLVAYQRGGNFETGTQKETRVLGVTYEYALRTFLIRQGDEETDYGFVYMTKLNDKSTLLERELRMLNRIIYSRLPT